jgi:hypothetical protein
MMTHIHSLAFTARPSELTRRHGACCGRGGPHVRRSGTPGAAAGATVSPKPAASAPLQPSAFGFPLGQWLIVDTPNTASALVQAQTAQAEAQAATKCGPLSLPSSLSPSLAFPSCRSARSLVGRANAAVAGWSTAPGVAGEPDRSVHGARFLAGAIQSRFGGLARSAACTLLGCARGT